MHKFGVTAWPDKSNFTVEITTGEITDLHRLTPDEAYDLLKCLIKLLDGNECVHTHVHRIETKQGNMFILMLPISDRYTRAYTVSKRKLVELKTRLMGALNG